MSDDWASIAMPENVEDTVAEWFEVGDVSVGVGLLRGERIWSEADLVLGSSLSW